MRKIWGASIFAAGLAAATANAGFIDSDPANDEQAGADEIVLTEGSGLTYEATLTDGGDDVDWFSIDVPAGFILTVLVIPLDPPLVAPDTVAGIFNGAGDMLAFNDDAGIGFGSAVAFEVTETGKYFYAVSGFPDDQFEGDHPEEGLYSIKVSLVAIPTPGALALMGVAGVAGLRRRR